jgi:type IV secretion system protein VirD4
MYLLSRWLLKGTVLLWAYVLLLVGFISWPFSGFLLIGMGLATAARRRNRRGMALGSARWAEEEDLRRAGMLQATTGLILGRLFVQPRRLALIGALLWGRISSREACEQFRCFFSRRREYVVRASQAVHTAVFAPSGLGKGVSCIVPFLESCEDACVVIDPKGENARLTAEHRRAMGHDVRLLDPFGVMTNKPDTLNPIDAIDPNSAFAIDDCNDLAKALVVRSMEEKEPHWNDSAEAWIAAFAAVTVQYGGEEGSRSLQKMREILSDPARIPLAIKLMRESTAWNGMLARMGGQLELFVDRERSSTLSTVLRHLRFLDTPTVAASTRTSSFDPAKLRDGKMTVYLILPPEHMRALAALQRMWIATLLRAIVKGGLCPANRVHFVLDEAASLGHLEVLEDAVDKYRGYGVRLQFYYQSLGQLKKCFPNGQDQTLLSNTTQVFFGVNDTATAELISSRLGETTIILESGGTSSGTTTQRSMGCHPQDSTSSSYNTSTNWQQAARKLLKPEEVIALNPRVAITFAPGVPPVCTWLLRYYEESSWTSRPGWFTRFRKACRTLIAAVLWFCVSLFLAAAMTHVVDSVMASPRSVRVR